MPIVRGQRLDRDFTVIANRILNDTSLSWAARGMLAHLLSKPDHWAVNVKALINETRDALRSASRDAVYKILDELKAARYVSHKRNTDGSVVWTVFEEPYPEKPDEDDNVSRKPLPEIPHEEASKGKELGLEPHPEKPDQEKPDRDIPDVLEKTDKAVRTEKAEKTEALACPVDEIVRAYHEAMPDNRRVKVISDARRKAIAARWKQAARLRCEPFGYSDVESGISAWRRFFEVCAESPFLTGRAKPTNGRPVFVADIDFLMSESGFTKCLENKYHEEAA